MVHLSETNLDTLLEIIRRQSNEIDDLKAEIKRLGQWQHDVVECSRERLKDTHPTTARRVRNELSDCDGTTEGR